MQRAFRDVVSKASLLSPFASTLSVDARHARGQRDPDQVALLSSPTSTMSPDSPSDRTICHPLEPEKPRTHTRTPSLRGTLTPRLLRASLSITNGSQLAWLSLYFLSNLSLTLYNKFVLVRFPFPYTLTALHALCGSVGSYLLMERGIFEPRTLTTAENTVLVAFSVLYTVNIAISNLSLGLVTVPFHQVVRAATPVFVMSISYAFLGARYSTRKCLALIPVMAGVGFATFGDYYFTWWGLFLTLLGTLLAAVKTVVTNVLQSPAPSTSSTSVSVAPSGSAHQRASSTGSLPTPPSRVRLQLHPLDLLSRMSPLAFVQCVVFALLSGELERVRQSSSRDMDVNRALALLANGCLAFALNVVSFTANKKVGALSITVAANVKQVLTIVIAVFLFSLTITPINGVGILLTLIGGAWYAKVEYQEKQTRGRNAPSVTS